MLPTKLSDILLTHTEKWHFRGIKRKHSKPDDPLSQSTPSSSVLAANEGLIFKVK